MRKLLCLTLVALASLQMLAQTPIITTDKRYARGSSKAYLRATMLANGATVSKRGFCYSDATKEPTIEDKLHSGTLSNNGIIYKLTGLTPGTIYYARPFVTTSTGDTYYGEAIKIVTLPKGTITWTYDNGGDADQNARINAAVEECVDYWNSLTSIQGLNLSVHFGAQTPTADCSYGGWMRVGPNAAYQKTGTIMHEALHAIGVGQLPLWYGPSEMRANSTRGQWLGDRATELVQFLDNNTTTILNGDATHLWPYGINGAHEDNGTEFLYTACSLVAQAVGEDGLPATTSMGCGTPHYSFDQEDTNVYYIKSESEDYGLYTSYLVENASGNIVWQSMTSAEAAANDKAKWNVLFTPDNQYYQIKNVGTSKYMSYSGSGNNGIKMKALDTPTDKEDFQLMRSRIDVTTAAGSLVTTERGYWIINPNKSTTTPGCLTGAASGVTKVSPFDISNASTDQRWIFLSAEQATAMDNVGLLALKDEYFRVKAQVENIVATPHIELTAGAGAELSASIESKTATVNASTSAGEIEQCTTALITEMKTFLGKVKVADSTNPFDVTLLINNPTIDEGIDGWGATSGNYNIGSGAVEFYEKAVNFTQTVKSVPAGTYTWKLSGFQRPGTNDAQYTAYEAGTASTTVSMRINSNALGRTYLKHVMAERTATSLHSADKKMTDGTYVPNTMASAVAHFNAGYYDNEVTAYIQNGGNITLVVNGTNTNSSNWTILDNFRLYFYGKMTKDEVTGIEGVMTTPAERQYDNVIYDLSGRNMGTSVEALAPGLYIQNGKKFVK